MRARNLVCFLLILALVMPTVILLSASTAYAFDGLNLNSGIFRILQGILAIFLLGRFTGIEEESVEGDGANNEVSDDNFKDEEGLVSSDDDSDNDADDYIGDNSKDEGYIEKIEKSDWTQMVVRGLNKDEEEMLALLNKTRRNEGLNPLKVDLSLLKVARAKSQDMIDSDYFGHFSPNYGSPFDMMRELGISYYLAGENIAGAPNVTLAHKYLMSSPSHRDNILHPDYTHVGIGIIKGGSYGNIFSQEFARLR